MKSAFALALVGVFADQSRHQVYQAINSGKLSHYNDTNQSMNQLIEIVNGELFLTDSGWGFTHSLNTDISFGYKLLAWWYPYEFRDAIIFNPTFFLEGAAHYRFNIHTGDWFLTTFRLEGVGYRFNVFDMLFAYDPEDNGYCYDGTFWTESFFLKLYVENLVYECHESFLGGDDEGSLASNFKNLFNQMMLKSPEVSQDEEEAPDSNGWGGETGCYSHLYTPQLAVWEKHFDETIDFLEEFNEEGNWIDWSCSGDVNFDRDDYDAEADDASNEQDFPEL
uniref:Uncharacterized protein n=1 Tax=Strombidinopsis acuminata TaxID=141414 RepID=A0A7S3VY29_9SPIT|mmetsp:Transcript_107100/g.148147  ORF Transcript_107100/g.148147 Transcript_107100/m.148147 type:complete len:279 (+) Transcript_107100:11-847(+)